jgi:hypothetical protein
VDNSQADQIMLQMSAVWWNAKPPDPTLKAWHMFLLDKKFNTAQTTVEALATSSDYWPSISAFWIHYQATSRHEVDERKATGVLPGVKYLSKEENLKRFAELRDMLKKVGHGPAGK